MMVERSEILKAYTEQMKDLWKDRRMGLSEIQTLKVFCEVHHLTVEEHEAVVEAVQVDWRELVDENHVAFSDWLRARRQNYPAGSGALRYAIPLTPVRWKKHLPKPPTAWQNPAAGLSVVLIVVLFLMLFA